ncbi:MAG: hypothetical protein IJ604_03605 [Prevotella sp.]|nr:hypothetical protein [Prevotella sp.]MBR1462450.1 hypothetical protein [Prevotella sp.]
MSKRQFIFSLFAFLVANACGMNSQTERINDIKKSKAYLYAEATMDSQEEALTVACNLLHEEVLQWASERAGKDIPSAKTLDLKVSADTITARRINKYRVFAYIKKNALLPFLSDTGVALCDSLDTDGAEEAEPCHQNEARRTQHDTLITDKVSQIINRKFFSIRNGTLDSIINAKTFFELRTILPSLKEKGVIADYGKYASTEHPELCYLIVYDAAGNIRAVLGKGEEERENLKSGKREPMSNYRGCGAIWFTLTIDN